MQSNSQQYKRSDSALDKAFVYKIGNNTVFVDSEYNVVPQLERFEGLHEIYEHSFLKEFPFSFIHVYDMGTLDYIEGFKLGIVERNYLNLEGIHIFLTEQLFHTTAPKQSMSLDSISRYEIYDTDEEMWSPELDSIEKFIKLNKLEKVKVYVNFEDPKQVYKDKYNFTIKRYDATLNALSNRYKKLERKFIGATIDKHFWCGNWRYETHRHITTAFASKLDTLYSWQYTDTEHRVLENLWFDINDFKYKHQVVEGIYHLNENCKSIDLQSNSVEISGDITDKMIRPIGAKPSGPEIDEYTSKDLYANTFCSIINFASFNEPFPSYDEKVLNAIINQRPFICIGPPGSLELMKEDGFKTYNNFWDESYDKEWDHTKRLEKIFDLLLEIDSWSIAKCQSVYQQMMPIIFYNYRWLKEMDIQHEMRSPL